MAKIEAVKRRIFFLLLALPLLQPACIWKLWSKGDPEKRKEKIYDVYGTVQTITQDRLVVSTKRGELSFVMGPASIKGSDFGPGAYVHVYYKRQGEVNVVTMVVEKVK